MSRNRNTSTAPRRGFSLIELVIVVVIIGIIAAIAIPRMSRGTAGAADSALGGNLSVLRNAIELYATEHGGKFPAPTTIAEQLTSYTNDVGDVSPDGTKTGTFVYGPYLRKIPPVTVGPLKNDNVAANKIKGGTTPDGSAAGWLYDSTTGTIKANVVSTGLENDPGKDQNGKKYSDY